MNFIQVKNAAERLKPYINRTPLYNHEEIDGIAGAEVHLKLEGMQKTGAFKARGAFTKLLSLDKNLARKGVVTPSSGNHGAAVAYAARMLGMEAVIVLPETVIEEKRRNIEKYGSTIITCGTTSDERAERAREMAAAQGKTFVHSFDDPQIITGQGTVGYEILQQNEEIQVIVVPIGGGGLISGISLLKEEYPGVKIIGVEPSGSASMKQSVERGKITPLDQINTLADGLRARQPGELTFDLASRYVDAFVTVEEEEIIDSLLVLLEKGRILVEPSGAVALAYVLRGHLSTQYQKIACIVSGSNFSARKILSFLDKS